MSMEDSSEFRRRSKKGRSASVAGYEPMDEDRLHHSGVRGGKSCCLCVGITILLIIALLNALVTVGLIYFMSFKLVGMGSVEFLPGHNAVRFLQSLSADGILAHNIVASEEMDVTGSSVTLQADKDSQAFLDTNHTVITSEDFQLKSTKGKSLFSTNIPFNLDLYQVTNLHASEVEVGSIKSSGRYDGLHVQSFKDLDLIGMEGVRIETENQLKITSKKEMVLTSREGAVIFDPAAGITLTPDMPMEGKAGITPSATLQHKLCVCMPSGKVFSVPIVGPDSGCHAVNEDVNPCAEN